MSGVKDTKLVGEKTEIIVISEFIRNGIPVSIPFGDNQPYDLVIDTIQGFKSVQVKHGNAKNGVIEADVRKRIGCDKVKYTTYDNLVDYIAIWCEDTDECYLLSMDECNGKTRIRLRIDSPRNNSCISTIVWAKDHLLRDKILLLKK